MPALAIIAVHMLPLMWLDMRSGTRIALHMLTARLMHVTAIGTAIGPVGFAIVIAARAMGIMGIAITNFLIYLERTIPP